MSRATWILQYTLDVDRQGRGARTNHLVDLVIFWSPISLRDMHDWLRHGRNNIESNCRS